MVGVVECVEEVLVEGVNICESGKSIEDGLQLFAKGVLCKLDFSEVECSNTTNLEAGTDDGGRLSCGSREDNVKEFLRCGHWRNCFPCLQPAQLASSLWHVQVDFGWDVQSEPS